MPSPQTQIFHVRDSSMQSLYRHCCLIIASAFLYGAPAIASAECNILQRASELQASNEYVVSVILQKHGAPEVIRIAHSIVETRDANHAVGVTTAKAREANPGYKVISSLASPRSSLYIYQQCHADL